MEGLNSTPGSSDKREEPGTCMSHPSLHYSQTEQPGGQDLVGHIWFVIISSCDEYSNNYVFNVASRLEKYAAFCRDAFICLPTCRTSSSAFSHHTGPLVGPALSPSTPCGCPG